MLAGVAFSVSDPGRGMWRALALFPLLAWTALAVMTVRWVQDRQCHWLWPTLGSVCGVASSVFFVGVFFFYIGAIPLSTYLVYWHLRARLRGKLTQEIR